MHLDTKDKIGDLVPKGQEEVGLQQLPVRLGEVHVLLWPWADLNLRLKRWAHLPSLRLPLCQVVPCYRLMPCSL